MKHSDGESIDYNFQGFYPRRSLRKGNYEIWLSPYVNDETYYNDNIIVAKKVRNKWYIGIFSEYEEQLKNLDYINSVGFLYHDICRDMYYYVEKVNDSVYEYGHEYFMEQIDKFIATNPREHDLNIEKNS